MRTNIFIFLVLLSFVSCKEKDNDTPQNELTVADIDNNVYKTKKIGNQVWMAENLRVTHFRNGNAIPNVADSKNWTGLSTAGMCYYNNDSAINNPVYGALYNGYAIADTQNIAPEGWHVATKDDWVILMETLGGDTVAGGKMKEEGIAHWNDPNTGADNTSGFSGLPGGYRSGNSGTYVYLNELAYWWTCTNSEASDRYYSWSLSYNSPDLKSSNDALKWAFSVRCVKD